LVGKVTVTCLLLIGYTVLGASIAKRDTVLTPGVMTPGFFFAAMLTCRLRPRYNRRAMETIISNIETSGERSAARTYTVPNDKELTTEFSDISPLEFKKANALRLKAMLLEVTALEEYAIDAVTEFVYHNYNNWVELLTEDTYDPQGGLHITDLEEGKKYHISKAQLLMAAAKCFQADSDRYRQWHAEHVGSNEGDRPYREALASYPVGEAIIQYAIFGEERYG